MFRLSSWCFVVPLFLLAIPSNGTEDLYRVLGVSPSASTREIRKAYKELAKKWHPDKVQGEEAKETAQKKFMAINAAHEILSDPEERQNYDDGRNRPNSHGAQYQRYYSQQGFRSQEELFRHIFQQRANWQRAQWQRHRRHSQSMQPVLGGGLVLTILVGGLGVMIYSMYMGNYSMHQTQRGRRHNAGHANQAHERAPASPPKPKLDSVQKMAMQLAPTLKQVDAQVLAADRGKFLVLAMPLQSLMNRRGTWEMLAGVAESLSRDPVVLAWIHPIKQRKLGTLLLRDFVHPIKRSLDPLDPEPCLLVINPKRTKGTVLLCPRHEQSWNQPTLEQWLTRLVSGEVKWKTVEQFESRTRDAL